MERVYPNYSLLLLAFSNTQCNSETVLHWQMELLLDFFEGCKDMTTIYLTGSLSTGVYVICHTDNAIVIFLRLPDLWLWRKAQGWLWAVALLGQRLYTFKWCWYRLTFWWGPLAQSHWKVQNAALNYMWFKQWYQGWEALWICVFKIQSELHSDNDKPFPWPGRQGACGKDLSHSLCDSGEPLPHHAPPVCQSCTCHSLQTC